MAQSFRRSASPFMSQDHSFDSARSSSPANSSAYYSAESAGLTHSKSQSLPLNGLAEGRSRRRDSIQSIPMDEDASGRATPTAWPASEKPSPDDWGHIHSAPPLQDNSQLSPPWTSPSFSAQQAKHPMLNHLYIHLLHLMQLSLMIHTLR